MRSIFLQLISLLFVSTCFLMTTIMAQRSQGRSNNRLQEQDDSIDVPVRAGYRIMGNDDDGYLEDGIIVKTKGTGYIDPKYRKRYPQLQQLTPLELKQYYGREYFQPIPLSSSIPSPSASTPTTATSFESRRPSFDFYPSVMMATSASSYAPRYYRVPASSKKYLKSEIIYGRRAW